MSLVLNHAEYETVDFIDAVWMSTAIYRFIKIEGERIFPELMSIPHFSGDLVFGIPQRNICLWPAVSQVAAHALLDLLQDKQIDMLPCLPEVYAHADAPIPDYPIAFGYGPFETTHWMPVKFHTLSIRGFPKQVKIDA